MVFGRHAGRSNAYPMGTGWHRPQILDPRPLLLPHMNPENEQAFAVGLVLLGIVLLQAVDWRLAVAIAALEWARKINQRFKEN